MHMNDIEANTERLLESITYHKQESNKNIWLCAFLAWKVYGRHKDYVTKAIADAAGVSVSAVKSWVNSYRCFVSCLILEYEHTRTLRRELSLTHFRTMYELAQKYKIAPKRQLHYLGVVLGYKADGKSASVDVLTREVEADYKHEPQDWGYWWSRLRNPLEQLASFDGELPSEIKTRVIGLLALFDAV